MSLPSKRVKCEGRFHEFRQYLFEEALAIVLDEGTFVTEKDLQDAWDLVSPDIFSYDHKDPYYRSGVDVLRRRPQEDYLSLVSLFPSLYHLEDDLVQKYALAMGNRADIARVLASMADHPERFFQGTLDREPSKVVLPEGKNLRGYVISGNTGIGTISPGGSNGGGIRSDSPFLLEIYKVERNGEQNLAGVVGFWAQDNAMLVSQMQSCGNAQYPEEVQFGVASLTVAETAARLMGLDKVLVYNARANPIFREHPDSWSQLGKDFVCMWDGSATKLGYDGSRNQHYEKDLRNGTGSSSR